MPHPKAIKDSTLTVEEIFEILEQDWLYDLLPGNGQDDYILQTLKTDILLKATEQ